MHVRPPVVTILGHVDHGKTSLLDYIRKSRLASKEHGEITQRIGAYEIDSKIKGYPTSRLTFIDTPGHEAFSQLRSRGATVADIAVLVIDAKDSLKPQTIESIYHIKNANLPFLVALNKMDLPDANPDKVQKDLLKHEVIVEEKGGNVPCLQISAKTGKGVTELLEALLLLSSDQELKTDPKAEPEAYIIETKKDKRGVVASIVLKNGTLRVGDTVYAGEKKAKIRNMISDMGESLSVIQPSRPVELLGFAEIPEVGMHLSLQEEEKTPTKEDSAPTEKAVHPLLQRKQKQDKKLSLILKADSQGSLDAIVQSLGKNENIHILLSAVGEVNRSDVFLAKTTKAIIVGFAVQPQPDAQELAKQEKIIIKTYAIIYELIEELEEVTELMKEKERQEKNIKGEAKILATFVIEGETIYGVKITKGKVNIGDTAELYRGDNLIGKTKLISLKHRAKSIQEVKKEQEAGMIFNPPLDIKIGDVVKFIL